MRHLDYRMMIDRGRKAGLGTRELYSALSGRRPEGGDLALGQADGNGFAAGYDQHGHRVYQPVEGHRRP